VENEDVGDAEIEKGIYFGIGGGLLYRQPHNSGRCSAFFSVRKVQVTVVRRTTYRAFWDFQTGEFDGFLSIFLYLSWKF
jgi:hypothetical protein